MPAYHPIEIGVLEWKTNGIAADFILPDDDTHALRISFDRPCFVRVSDEMAVSTEDDTPNEGLVPIISPIG